MDEELEARAPDHEPVPAGAAELVAKRAATALAPGRMPAIYLGHGAPPLVDDPLWVVQLEAWARAMPRPRAILDVLPPLDVEVCPGDRAAERRRGGDQVQVRQVQPAQLEEAKPGPVQPLDDEPVPP